MGATCAEELIRVRILPDTDKYFRIGTSMTTQERVEVLLFLV